MNTIENTKEFLPNSGLPRYPRLPKVRAGPGVNGCLGVYLFHRIEGEVAHFQTLTFWSSEEAIRAFAGDEVLCAKYYPEDQEYLLEFEEQVQHYEVTEGYPLNTV